MLLPDAFLTLTRDHAARPWLYALASARWLSYAEARTGALQAVGVLRAHRVGPQQTFAVLLPNTVETLSFVFAALLENAVVVLLNPLLHAREIARLLRHSESRLLVTTAAVAARQAEADPLPCPTFCIDRDPLPPPGAPAAVGGRADDAFCILYTSGTAGDPKGVVLTAGNVAANITAIAHFYGFDERLRMLSVLPLCSVHGLVVTALLPFFCGAQTVFGPVFTPYDAPGFWPLLAAHRVTHFSAVPSMIRILAHCSARPADLDLPAFSHAFCSSAPLFAAEQADFEARFGCPIAQCYGLTETAGWCCFGSPTAPRALGSVGRPHQCAIRLLDEAGQPVAAGAVGEVVLRSPRVMQGYFRNPAATAAVKRAGEFYTGDLGRWGADGELFLVGRRKLMIARGGFKVHPGEVDEALATHPDVLESATVGVDAALRGEELRTYVVRRQQHATVAELRAWLRARIAAYKVPDQVVFVDALPRGIGGKVAIQELKQRDAAPGSR